MKKLLLVCGLAFSHMAFADAEDMTQPKPEDIKKGAALYAQHCSACHGPHMADPEGAFDLRKFPRDQHDRFVTSVTKGKNSMPPWGGLLTPDDIGALWAYVVAGEKN